MEEMIPRLQHELPALFDFARTAALQIEAGDLRDGDELGRRIAAFYTDDRVDAIARVAPGWREMSGYAGGATRAHVTQALIALQLLPEYRAGSQRLQALLEWSELHHDLGKQVISGQRDAVHAFRGATMAARALPKIGFRTTDAYPALLEPWTRRVHGATIAAPDGKGLIHDNRALPEILEGIGRLFGVGSAAALIVEAVLLHQSLTVIAEWPNPGSLTDAEIPSCIRPELVPLLEGVMLVDSDAWQLFDPASKVKFREATLAVFAKVRQLVVR
jgi:hypothetical protein